jgi:flagellar biogenesis protein FliO
LQLIRLGRRLLLVSVTPEHAETLTEITDPDEVNHLTSLCRQQQSGSISDSFREVLHQLGSPSRAARQVGPGLDELELTPPGTRHRG